MDSDEIMRIEKRAKLIARKKGRPDHAEDFAQYALLKFLENPSRKSTLNQLFIDYSRQTFGDTKRSVTGRMRALAQAVTLDDVVLVASVEPIELETFPSQLTIDKEKLMQSIHAADALKTLMKRVGL